MNRSRLAALSAGAMFLIASVFVPAVAFADTGNTNTIKVLPATTTVSPAGTGSFTLNIVANGSVDISGAGAGLTFDNTTLTLTAIAKTIVAVDPTSPPAYGGFPSAANLATFITNANAAGSIPVIGWSYTDGASFEPANGNEGIFSATFSVVALGDSTVTPFEGLTGGILDGRAAGYGSPLTVTPVTGSVVNHVAPVFSISAPGTASVDRGASSNVTVSTATVSGTPGNITFSTGALPSGVSASFSPNPSAVGTPSTLTFSATAGATAGTFPVTVTGVDSADGTDTHSTTINLTVVAPNGFSLSSAPSTITVAAGANGTSSVSVTQITPTAGTVALSVTSALPAGVSASFSPTSATTSTSSTLTLSTTAAVVAGSYSVTVSGSNGTNVNTTTVNLIVTGPPPPNSQGVTVSGSLDGGFIALTCPTSVGIPLVRGNTNQVNVPCVVTTNTTWTLNVGDPAADAYKGYMVTGRPVDNVTNFHIEDSMHVLADSFIDVSGNVAYRNDVNLVTGGSILTGTNTANAPVVISQFVRASTHPGAYGIQLTFSALSTF